MSTARTAKSHTARPKLRAFLPGAAGAGCLSPRNVFLSSPSGWYPVTATAAVIAAAVAARVVPLEALRAE